MLLLLGNDLIKKNLVEMKIDSESLDQIFEVQQKGEGLIILRLVMITGQLNKRKIYQFFLQLELPIMVKASLVFPHDRNVERIIMVLIGEPLVHVLKLWEL